MKNIRRLIIPILIFLMVLFGGIYLINKTPVVPNIDINKNAFEATSLVATSTPPHTDFREISRGDSLKKQVIITINAGFGDKSAEGILSALRKHNLEATFFLVGNWIEEHLELTKRIAQEGHEIFNHSYAHHDYKELTAEEIKVDLQKMDDVLYKTVGIRTRPYYRAPSGSRNESVNRAAAEAGYQHIYWSVDPQDWRLDISGETIKSRVLNNVFPGAIVLFHIADSATGDVMDEILTELVKQGYELVSLTKGLKLK